MTHRTAVARRMRLLGGAALIALSGVSAAAAQTAAPTTPAAADAASDQDIVVTGSRLAAEGFSAPTPVAVVGAEDIKLAGSPNLERTLNQSPQFVASATGGSTVSGQGAGQSDLNLRGFGATRNLVLVNGRRYAIAGPDETVDINTIPSALVKRVEVVTGGSSAVYGSDAITGVVNFILRDDFEGVEMRAQGNANSTTSAHTQDYTLTVGGNFADHRGNVVISANFLKRDPITRRDRGGFTSVALSDGCIVPGSEDKTTRVGTPFAVPGGQTCRGAGGAPGYIFGGSGDIPNSRISGIPTFAAANPALQAAYTAAGLAGLGGFGLTFNDTGTTPRVANDPADRYNLAPDNYLVIPQKRYMINALGHYDFIPGVTGYTELHYSQNSVVAQLAPSNVGVATLLNVNNPYLTTQMQNVLQVLDSSETGTISVASGPVTRTTTANDGLAVVTLGRRYQEVGPRTAVQRRNVFRGAFGFKGDIGDLVPGALRELSYDAYYSYAKTDFTEELNNALSRSALQTALLRGSGGAAPLCNVFGANITTACIKAISVTATNTTTATQQVAAATVTGKFFKLPAGDIAFDLGVEWRKDKALFRPDQYLASGDVVGFNAGLPTGGSISAKEVYGELRVPILADIPFFKSLTANGAFRYSKYSLGGVGGVWTYLAGGEWQPVSSITFRGQYQRAIRAPNVNELYGGLSRTNPLATDPCSARQPVAQQSDTVRATCVATGVPAAAVFTAAVQPNTFFPVDQGGNPNVGAEKSDTVTFGAVFTPTFIPRLRVSVDYFSIKLDGAISLLGGGLNNTLNLCYNVLHDASSQFCQAIRRDPTTGAITDQYAAQILTANTGQLKTSGIDFAVRYMQPLEFGVFGKSTSSLSFGSDWTYLKSFTSTPVAAFPNIQNKCAGAFGQTCGEPLPRWRGTTRVTWDLGDFSLSVRHRYVGTVTDDRYIIPHRQGSATAPKLADLSHPVEGDRNYIDLSFTADVLKNIQIFGGANNVFANKPPVIGSAQVRANTYPATWDSIGTEYFLGAVVKF
ncbi:MAG TPA: TonB-dependent receptor [Sphingomonas sp.]|uniref:TonB-dependent receptor domain-containing protein n=1 Tax=Sphingomonas sp. TaxID=28214 RepID=UPI002BFA478A|nr:TonB-dependent receptor [Sphingomonas sp.]HMI18948.1 TonB-dependent receptor [Sphingomonas sp.]